MGAGQAVIVGIAGRRGSGKSTMARYLAERCYRVVVWDPMAEHRWVPNRFSSLERLEQFMVWASGQSAFAGRYVPETAELTDDFEEICELVYDYGDLVFLVEEVPMVCTPSSLPGQFDRIVRLGRHQGVSVIYTAQRLAETARRLTAATDYFIVFQHHEPRDLDAIADRCGREVADRVARLPRHGYLAWSAVEAAIVPLETVVQELRRLSRRDNPVRCDNAVTLANRQAYGTSARVMSRKEL